MGVVPREVFGPDQRVPREVTLCIMKNQIIQTEMLLEIYARPKYDSFAARIAAPIWWFVWVTTAGKMGKR